MPQTKGTLHHAISLLAGIVLSAILLSPHAKAEVFVVFDEWGKGFACTIGVGAAGYPVCASSPNPSTPNFLKLPSGLSTDPNTGLTNVLTYILPGIDLTAEGPVILPNSGFGSDIGDAFSFSGSQIFVYSDQDFLGTGNCATGINATGSSATGCDGLADIPLSSFVLVGGVSSPYAGPEVGPEGNNEILYNPPGFTFDLQSDELPIFEPPVSDSHRDLTGLGAAPVLVSVAVGQDLNPFEVPEPSSGWLLLGVFVVLFVIRGRRHPDLPRVSTSPVE